MKTIRTAFASALAGGAMLAMATTPSQSAEMRPILTHGAVQAMVAACVAMAESEGWRLHIAIMDTSGALRGYVRMTDAQNVSHGIAMGKARLSSGINATSRQIGGFALGEDGPNALAFVPGLNFFPGGVPIASDDVHIGGIGVSGATGDQDEQCAMAGIQAAQEAGLL